jgi:peptidoglycan/xylan/chitin deacetylase (PgdA/CDA1 family)
LVAVKENAADVNAMKKKSRWIGLGVALAAVTTTQMVVAPEAHASFARPCRNGYVSISFDDGPTASTPDLLRTLRRNDIRATFFDLGAQAQLFPQYVSAERAGGHDVANHSYDHPSFLEIGDDAAIAQLAHAQQILTTGADKPAFYRPPYGATNDAIAQRAYDTLGLTEVIWTVDTNDWDGRSSANIVNTVAAAKNGDFVLMHDGYPNTIAAISKIASGLDRRGLCDGRIAHSETPVPAWENLSFNAAVKAWER